MTNSKYFVFHESLDRRLSIIKLVKDTIALEQYYSVNWYKLNYHH